MNVVSSNDRAHGMAFTLLQWSLACGSRDQAQRQVQREHMQRMQREKADEVVLSEGSGVEDVEDEGSGAETTVAKK